jgi:organic radical activating enzyme
MYIRITSKCNMECEHCCYSCSPNKGEHMNFKTFKRCFEVLDSEYITLGGGEPTLNPQFEKFLLYSLSKAEGTFIITNGKHTERALLLASLNKQFKHQKNKHRTSDYYKNDKSLLQQKFGAELSLDPYHEPIDDKVKEIFKEQGMIRDTSNNLINNGRCDFGEDDRCVCDDFLIEPDGTIKQCGCDGSPIWGNVWDKDLSFNESGCYKEIESNILESV